MANERDSNNLESDRLDIVYYKYANALFVSGLEEGIVRDLIERSRYEDRHAANTPELLNYAKSEAEAVRVLLQNAISREYQRGTSDGFKAGLERGRDNQGSQISELWDNAYREGFLDGEVKGRKNSKLTALLVGTLIGAAVPSIGYLAYQVQQEDNSGKNETISDAINGEQKVNPPNKTLDSIRPKPKAHRSPKEGKRSKEL